VHLKLVQYCISCNWDLAGPVEDSSGCLLFRNFFSFISSFHDNTWVDVISIRCVCLAVSRLEFSDCGC
jgi:hypothetical protein